MAREIAKRDGRAICRALAVLRVFSLNPRAAICDSNRPIRFHGIVSLPKRGVNKDSQSANHRFGPFLFPERRHLSNDVLSCCAIRIGRRASHYGTLCAFIYGAGGANQRLPLLIIRGLPVWPDSWEYSGAV